MERGLRNGNNKRNSGILDDQRVQEVQQQLRVASPGIQRRPSKNASSADRRGQVFTDDFPDAAARARTPDVPIDNGTAMTPDHDSVATASPTSTARSYREPLERGARIGFGQTPVPDRPNDNGNRPRGVTLEGTARSRSPITRLHRPGRIRVGSLNAADVLQVKEGGEPGSGSIGFPSIVNSGPGSARSGRHVKSPPRPLSPVTHGVPTFPVDFGDSLPSPTSDTSRILSLMKTTCGRMHGILSFRTSRTGAWNSGYCAINVATGSLIYQESKGNITQTKTLVPDLRGCLVRTQGTRMSESGFLEVFNRSSGVLVHLRPKVPETFDSWLAALLCWQPLSPRGTPSASITRTPRGSVAEPRPNNQRRNSSFNVKDAAAIKFGKMLFWDHEARVIATSSVRRISTYKQQRSASGTPWRKVSATLQANGQVKLNSERDNDLLCVVPLALLSRSAIQRLHPSVLDDEYCIGIYPRYTSTSRSPLDMKKPIYLSLETRVLFESWYALLKAFTIPELYGPESSSIQSPALYVEAGVDAPVVNTDSMLRLERVLSMRITEAKFYSHATSLASASRSRAHPLESPIADYHAEVLLDEEIRGRTAVKSQTSNPFWREDYTFGDLPPNMGRATVKIKSRNTSQRDWTLVTDGRYNQGNADIHNLNHMDIVGEVQISPLDTSVGELEIKLQDLERCRDIERWWQLTNEHGEVVGDVLLKVRLDEAVVLMSHEYQTLTDLLHQFSNGLTQQIVSTFPAAEVRELPELLLNIFQVSGCATEWLISLVEDEIDGINKDLTSISRFRFSRRIASNDSYDSGVEREMFVRDMKINAAAEANLLFRGNSLLTRALDMHMKRTGKEYLEEVLGEHVRDIDESDPDCEVDPMKVGNTDVLDRNWRNLAVLTENIWNSISQSVNQCPPELRLIFRHIRSCAEDRYGDFRRSVSYSSVSGFLFLRFLVPAVLNPKLFGLLKDHPRPRAYRTLTFIAKSLQTLANMNTFGTKEPWMEPMNAFLAAKRQEFKDFVDSICNIAADHSTNTIPPPYATPMQIKTRLPTTSREGFPSLPFLLDHAYDCAALVSLWIDATSDVSTNNAGSSQASALSAAQNKDHGVGGSSNNKQPREDERHLVEFDETCRVIRAKTRDMLGRAAQLDRPSGVLEVKWEELVAHMDRKTHRLAQRPMRPQRLSSDPSLASARQRQSPVSTLRSGSGAGVASGLASGAASLGMAPVASSSTASLDATLENTTISAHGPPALLSSPPPLPPGSAPAYRTRAPAPLGTATATGTGRSSPIEATPPGSGSVWSSGAEDERFPAHALSWGDDGDHNDNTEVSGRETDNRAPARDTDRAAAAAAAAGGVDAEPSLSGISRVGMEATPSSEGRARRMRRFGARNLSDGSRQLAIDAEDARDARDARTDDAAAALSPGLASTSAGGSAVGLREFGLSSTNLRGQIERVDANASRAEASALRSDGGGGSGGSGIGGSGIGGGGGTAAASSSSSIARPDSSAAASVARPDSSATVSSSRRLIDGWGFRRKGASAALAPGTPSAPASPMASGHRRDRKGDWPAGGTGTANGEAAGEREGAAAEGRRGSGGSGGTGKNGGGGKSAPATGTLGRKGKKGKLVKEGS